MSVRDAEPETGGLALPDALAVSESAALGDDVADAEAIDEPDCVTALVELGEARTDALDVSVGAATDTLAAAVAVTVPVGLTDPVSGADPEALLEARTDGESVFADEADPMPSAPPAAVTELLDDADADPLADDARDGDGVADPHVDADADTVPVVDPTPVADTVGVRGGEGDTDAQAVAVVVTDQLVVAVVVGVELGDSVPESDGDAV